MGRCQCFALFDTLEYLERGGRIGKALALLGTLLSINPLIMVRDGEAHDLGKERSRSRTIARLQKVARGFAPLEGTTVVHSTTPEDARMLAESLREMLPEAEEPFIARLDPVVGTYVDPGALGIGLVSTEAR